MVRENNLNERNRRKGMRVKERNLLPRAAPLFVLFLLFLFVSQPADWSTPKDFFGVEDFSSEGEARISGIADKYNLLDYYREDGELDMLVETILGRLSDEELVSQMVITYFSPRWKDLETVIGLIESKNTGGVIFFEKSNSEVKRLTKEFNNAAMKSSSILLPVYSIDGEPSFMQNRFGRAFTLPVAEDILTVEEASKIAGTIALLLRRMGIHINYAPVCDISFNRDIIGLRSFGSDLEQVSELSQAFIQSTQANGIVATAKHFPGHGSIEGDTHKELVFVEGEPPELAIFQSVIDGGVISVMVGHVGVRNHDRFNTEGKPSTLSRTIVTDLLKNELGFGGIVVTDAMTMSAVKSFSLPSYHAARAGCDMILMPDDELQFISMVMEEIQRDQDFRKQITDSVRKIIRLKVCLGLINGQENNEES